MVARRAWSTVADAGDHKGPPHPSPPPSPLRNTWPRACPSALNFMRMGVISTLPTPARMGLCSGQGSLRLPCPLHNYSCCIVGAQFR